MIGYCVTPAGQVSLGHYNKSQMFYLKAWHVASWLRWFTVDGWVGGPSRGTTTTKQGVTQHCCQLGGASPGCDTQLPPPSLPRPSRPLPAVSHQASLCRFNGVWWPSLMNPNFGIICTTVQIPLFFFPSENCTAFVLHLSLWYFET